MQQIQGAKGESVFCCEAADTFCETLVTKGMAYLLFC
jgi:hypothetical protein